MVFNENSFYNCGQDEFFEMLEDLANEEIAVMNADMFANIPGYSDPYQGFDFATTNQF